MFKMGLLTSTAMTAVALLLSGAPDAAQAQTAMHATDRDANARFLCNYGKFGVSVQFDSLTSSSWYNFSARVAVPVTGNGQTVRHIIVMESRGHPSEPQFSAAVYSNSSKGRPGKRISGGIGNAATTTCGKVDVPITPTTLQPNTTYWIEENVPSGPYAGFYWYANRAEKQKAFVKKTTQFCSSGCHTVSQTGWIEQKGPGPWFKLK